MPKIYRTMQGEQIDIEGLFQKHELSQAVGNMNANARGDELGSGGVIIKTREQKAREYYQKKKAMKEVDERHRSQAAKTNTVENKVQDKDLTDPTGEEEIKNNE